MRLLHKGFVKITQINKQGCSQPGILKTTNANNYSLILRFGECFLLLLIPKGDNFLHHFGKVNLGYECWCRLLDVDYNSRVLIIVMYFGGSGEQDCSSQSGRRCPEGGLSCFRSTTQSTQCRANNRGEHGNNYWRTLLFPVYGVKFKRCGLYTGP
jgi:hypothetical protein